MALSVYNRSCRLVTSRDRGSGCFRWRLVPTEQGRRARVVLFEIHSCLSEVLGRVTITAAKHAGVVHADSMPWRAVHRRLRESRVFSRMLTAVKGVLDGANSQVTEKVTARNGYLYCAMCLQMPRASHGSRQQAIRFVVTDKRFRCRVPAELAAQLDGDLCNHSKVACLMAGLDGCDWVLATAHALDEVVVVASRGAGRQIDLVGLESWYSAAIRARVDVRLRLTCTHPLSPRKVQPCL